MCSCCEPFGSILWGCHSSCKVCLCSVCSELLQCAVSCIPGGPVMRQWHLPLLLALVLVCTSVSSHDCGFTFEETQVIGHGDLFNYPGLWNNEVSTVMVVDRTTGNYLLYPQLGTGSSVFHDNVGGTNISLASRQEVFMFFGSDGAHKWTSVAYSRTFPVLEQDTYIFNEVTAAPCRLDPRRPPPFLLFLSRLPG